MTTVDFASPQGKQLIKNLYAYSFTLFNRLYKKEINERGKSFKDYVTDALEKHLRGKDGYNPEKSSLEYYLKKYVIRQQLFNDLPADVKKLYAQKVDKDDVLIESNIINEAKVVQINTETQFEAVLPEHDKELLHNELQKEIANDEIAQKIYIAITNEKFNLSDRAEICEAFNIELKDFDNARRRFITILRRVAIRLDL